MDGPCPFRCNAPFYDLSPPGSDGVVLGLLYEQPVFSLFPFLISGAQPKQGGEGGPFFKGLTSFQFLKPGYDTPIYSIPIRPTTQPSL
jgi:hypothetical protein